MTTKRSVSFLFIGITNIALGTIAYISTFTRLIADDFCSFYFANRLGLLRSIWYWHINWHGAYTSSAVDWLILDKVSGPYNLGYFISGTLILWLIICILILFLQFHTVNKHEVLSSWALAGIFLYLVFLLAPDIRQGFFWWGGMRSYTLPLVVITSYILIFLLFVYYFKTKLLVSSFLAFIFLFLLGGLCETFLIGQLIFFLFLIGLHILKIPNRPNSDLIILLACLAGTIVSLIIVILAPGNAIRQGDSPIPNMMELTIISLQSYGSYLFVFFSVPEKATGLIGGILSVLWFGSQFKELAPSKFQVIPAYIIGGIAISMACFPPGVYGYFDAPPPRTMIIPTFFLVLALLCASFLLGAWLSAKNETTWQHSKYLIFVSILMLGYSSFSFSSTLIAQRPVFVEFAQRWDKINAVILDAKANHMNSVKIPNMNSWTNLGYPTDNPKYWQTVCYSQYYGIQVIGPPFQ